MENKVLERKLRGPKMRVSGFPSIEPLCNAFASIIATMARKEVLSGIDVSVFGYEVVRHGEYLRQLYAPSAIFLISFPETGGSGLVKAHPRLLAKVLDVSLGGDGDFEVSEFERELTQIDLAIYGRFVDLVCSALDEAVHEVCGRSAIGHAQRIKFEEQPGMVRIAPDRAEVFVIKLNFNIGDDERGAGMDFVVPISTIEPLKKDLSGNLSTNETTKLAWERYMAEQVGLIALEADGIIELGAFSVGELSRLQQGDLIELPVGAIEDVTLRVETREGPTTMGRGRLGAKGRHKALRLNDDLDADFLRPLKEQAEQRTSIEIKPTPLEEGR
ncbi:MAG: FliM/FliN family flagellar motor switch protein [Pseudomonadota bacterium]